MFKIILLILVLSAVCVVPSHGGGGYGGHGGYGGGGKHKGPPKPYAFAYGVKNKKGGGFGQQEESDGKTVRGSYTVDLPDGRTQIVKYVAGHKGGYHADVTYIGKAHHPPTKQHGHGGGYGGGGDGGGKSFAHNEIGKGGGGGHGGGGGYH